MTDRSTPDRTDAGDRLEPGTAVEVLSSFNQVWVNGFVVATFTSTGYKLLRVSDQRILPVTFLEDEIRPVW